MKKLSKAASLIALVVSSASYATPPPADIDPSDLTRANTSAYVAVNNQGDVKGSGSLSYTLKNGQMAMGTLEGTMGNDGSYKDSRLQYFHVFNLASATVPRVAASLDIIDNQQFTTAAIGAISIFKTPIDSLTFFGRVGVMTGQYKDDFSRQLNVSNTDITGAMGAAYAVWKPAKDGSYFAVYPEYTYLDGDIQTSSLKTTLMAATPLSADKKRWGQFKIENTHTSLDTQHLSEKENETVAWFVYKAFF